MPMKSTRFKCVVDRASQSFILFFREDEGNERRTLTVKSWEQVQAVVEHALRGDLETDAEVKARTSSGKSPKFTTETIDQYLARGGTITYPEADTPKKTPAPAPDDAEAWDDILLDMMEDNE